MSAPYWSDGTCSLYLGDCREVLPELGIKADLIVADPPYGETSLEWDRWPEGWLDVAAKAARSLWCFGSLRMFLHRRDEFRKARWKLSQDVVWEKHNGSGLHNDRFRRVHELAAHWYQGRWADVYHDKNAIAEKTATKRTPIRRGSTPHMDTAGAMGENGGTALMRSVIKVHSMHGRAIHETEKPTGLLDPLVRYGCRPGGLVVDLFAGSGSTLDAARCTGRPAIGIEIREQCCEEAARRLSQMTLEVS